MVGVHVPELISLLDVVSEGGIEASLFTTFNAFLPFYEDVVLRRLLASGCRHNTILMDASQLAACLDDPSLRPVGAGYDYTLAPIRSRAAFHPKLMLLVGPKRAITCIGSHNLTLSGFGLNRETTYKAIWSGGSDERGADVARATWQATKHWLGKCGTALPRQTQRNILAMEGNTPWITSAGSAICLPRSFTSTPVARQACWVSEAPIQVRPAGGWEVASGMRNSSSRGWGRARARLLMSLVLGMLRIFLQSIVRVLEKSMPPPQLAGIQ